MSTLKKLAYSVSSFLPMQLLQKLSPVNTLFPYQHTVCNDPLPHIQELYSYKNVAQFSKDLDTLLKYNRPVTPQELIECLQANKPFPEKSFLLTFDDGFREIHDIIAPILLHKGVPAIFFVTPAFIDNKELFVRNKTSLLIHELINSKKQGLLKEYNLHLNTPGFSVNSTIETLKNIKRNGTPVLDELALKTGFSFDDYLTEKQPFLTTEQVLSLHKQGFTIGGHSMNHPYYEQLTLEEQVKQTIASCKYVQELTGNPHEYFSFPFSEEFLSQDLFDELNKSSINLLFGLQNQKEEEGNKMLHRFNAERPAIGTENQLKAILLLSYCRKLLGTQKVKRAYSRVN